MNPVLMATARPCSTKLMHHYTGPEFTYAHHWTKGDLVIYDNRSLIHSATWYDAANHDRNNVAHHSPRQPWDSLRWRGQELDCLNRLALQFCCN